MHNTKQESEFYVIIAPKYWEIILFLSLFWIGIVLFNILKNLIYCLYS